jgi:hypothetical protein
VGRVIEHSHHDMGGRPGGKVEAIEHDYADWERRIDAMAVLLWGIKGGRRRLTVDEHRKAIESLPPELYDTLSYYEKWVYALALCLIQRGVITSEELGKKLQDVSFQRQNHDMGGQPAARVARTEHDYEEWERRVDAMSVILGSEKKITVDERRRAIELLPPEAYDAMSYYERWTAALAETLVRRGMITTEELGKKMMEVRDRG